MKAKTPQHPRPARLSGSPLKGGRVEATEEQEYGWYFTMLGKLVLGRRGVIKNEQNRKNIYHLPHISPITAKTCSPSPGVGKRNNNSSTFTSLLRFFSPPLLVFSFSCAPSRSDPRRIPQPGEVPTGPGKLAVRHRYTDRTLPRHRILSGASHVTHLVAHGTFKDRG